MVGQGCVYECGCVYVDKFSQRCPMDLVHNFFFPFVRVLSKRHDFVMLSGAQRSKARAESARTVRADAKKDQEVEMMSDEDLDGGFEDVEDDESIRAGSKTEVNEIDDDDAAKNTYERMAPEGGSASSHGTSSLYTLPSNEEIHGLQETSDLYMNNMFKLQLDEMLKYIHPSGGHKQAIEHLLRSLQACIMRVPKIDPQPLSKAVQELTSRVGHSVHIPLVEPVPREDPAYMIAFEPPEALNLVGSWPLHTVTRRVGEMDVDMEVVMPSKLFQEKDTLNARYFTKRAFYLAVILAYVEQNHAALGVRAEWLYVGGDPRRSCLVLRPTPEAHDLIKTHTVVRIHAAHAPGTFPTSRLAPNRNNLRGSAIGASDQDTASLPPTPIYNACIAAESLRLAHLVYLHATSEWCKGFAEACQLLKIWATQRGFGALHLLHEHDDKHATRRVVAGTDDARFVLCMVLAHLLHGEPKVTDTNMEAGSYPGVRMRTKLSPGLSSVQLFRGVLEYLAKNSFATPVWMKAQPSYGLAPATDISPASFAGVFERTLVDPSGCVNLFAHWPAASVDLLQLDAAQSMRMLSDGSDHFADLFLVPQCTPLQRFDETASMHLNLHARGSLVHRLDAGSPSLWAIRRVLDVSGHALGRRARVVAICTNPQKTCTTEQQASGGSASPKIVELGVWLNAEHAWHQVEHGPSPDSPDAAAFRAFWGSVAELRRFRDGRVRESIVWPVSTLAQRQSIPRQIVRYALTQHACAKRIRFSGDAFVGWLDVPTSLAQRVYSKDPSVHGFQLLQTAYDTLARELRAMDELPLSVTGVTPAADALRSMSVFVPGPRDVTEWGHDVPDVMTYVPVHDVIITMESSGQWPDDLAAIQEMKTALYERMADVLSRRMPGTKMQVVYDSDATAHDAIYDQTCLQILMPTGFAFALRVHHDREQVLLHRLLNDKHARARAQAALRRYDMRFVHAPTHHAALQALQDHFPALGPTVRFVRRWFASQLLSTHFRAEAIELLCVAVFLTNAHGPPTTGMHGFVRALDLLARWDWRETPLLIPLENATRLAHHRKAALSDGGSALPDETAPAFPAAQRADVEQHFRTIRARDPAFRHSTWVLATEMDLDSKAWTHSAPTAMVADGVRQLAKRSLHVLKQDTSISTPLVRMLMTPAVEAYDFVVHVQPSLHVRYAESIAPDSTHWLATRKKRVYANLDDTPLRPSVYGSEVRPGFDPVYEFVTMLQTIYGDAFVLFYDEFGGTVIGGLWNTAYTKPHTFKVSLPYTSRPHAKGVVLNRPAILAEIQRLGQGIVERIDTKT